jgi:hypothetical protein
MLREKDQELARACEELRGATRDALAWFDRHPQLTGEKAPALSRELRKISVRARKLAGAAGRPMSVAVYGVSQVGKSVMTGAMTSPDERPTKVLIGPPGESEALNYKTQINPEGGKETTGLVTRFSVRPHEGATKAFPVALRMLREADIIKILANTHTHDLKLAWEEGRSSSPENLVALADSMSSLSGSPQLAGLEPEDVTDIREYVETELPYHPLAKAQPNPDVPSDPAEREACERYWAACEVHLPALQPAQRAEFLAPLWGEIREFSDLYLELKAGLDQLGHPTWAYAPGSAVLDREHGVIHVGTLYGLDREHAETLSGEALRSLSAITIRSGTTGREVSLSQPLVTALTRELRLTLEHLPWPFLEHADILDFPGARSRGKNTSFTELRERAETNTRSSCYLRGKVAVLFDSYVDELEANTLLLMMSHTQNEVPDLPKMVKGWIDKTHGETPQRRAEQVTSLFFIAAQADLLFNKKGGMQDFTKVIDNRLDENFGNFPGWIEEWTPGKPFRNVYLYRNPEYQATHIARYDTVDGVERETGYAEGFNTVREQFTADFLANAKVQRHFADPEGSLDAALTLNDGGATLMARALEPVCDPDLKYRQIAPKLLRLRDAAMALISPYFESDDIQKQVDERQDTIKGVIGQLGNRLDRVGPLIERLQADSSHLRTSYLRYVQSKTDEADTSQSDAGNRVLDRIFGTKSGDAPAPAARPGFGRVAVSDWRDQLAALAMDRQLSAAFSLDTESMSGLVREVLGLGERAGLERRIDAFAGTAEATAKLPQQIAYRIGMGTSEIINTVIDTMTEEDERPALATEAPPYPRLPETPEEIEESRQEYAIGWLKGLWSATELNARDGRGSLIDPEENRKLGAIINRLEAIALS